MSRDIDVTPKQRKIILSLLKTYLPNTTVWAYGSRARWSAQPHSDLDLVAFATPEQESKVYALKETFEESDLPFKVDFFVWDNVPDEFKPNIEKERVVLVKKQNSPNDAPSVKDLIAKAKLTINDGYRAKNSELGSNGLPFARAGNINDGFRFDGADCFPMKDLEKVGKKRSEVGDVLFTSKGTVGRLAFVTEDTPEFVYSPQLCFWRSHDQKTINSRWLYYWMHSSEFINQVYGVANKTDMAAYVSLTDQRKMNISLPPLETQQAIAHILGTLDDKIELNRRMNETLEAMAQALFKSWFVDFDPVKAKMEGKQPEGMDAETAALFPDKLVESELGLIPEGWEVIPLDRLATYQNGLALGKFPPESEENSLPVVKIAQLRKGNSDGADRASSKIKQECIIDNGDIVFSWSGTLMVDIWCGGKAALNQHLFKVTSSTHPKWLYYYWTKSHLDEFIRIANDKAVTMGHIKRSHLKEAKCSVPSRETINGLSNHFDLLTNRSEQLRIQTSDLAILRDSLLPKLISGEISVSEVEKQLESVL